MRELASQGRLLIDLEGEIQEEYRRHLNPAGQPGVGDRFYQIVLHSAPTLVERIALSKGADGEYVALPGRLVEIGFDPSDRKFAAIARQEEVPVYNCTDSDWVKAAADLEAEQIEVRHLCGTNIDQWFAR